MVRKDGKLRLGHSSRWAENENEIENKHAAAIAEEGLELLEAGADILGEIPLVGDMLEAVATAIIATISSFVTGFFDLLRTIGGVVEKWFTKIAEKLTEWAQDWKTWARMALYIVGCAGAAASGS